jgi:curved DNA-binding protein CbpA
MEINNNDTINLYEILGISHNATDKEIHKAYTTLSKKYHPDRPTGDSELFQLITNAFEILSNPDLKKRYDQINKHVKDTQNDFNSLREKSQAYQKSLKTVADSNDKLKFQEQWDQLNRKHNFDESKASLAAPSSKEAKQMYSELLNRRKFESEEDKPEQIFNNKEFDIKKFNEVFDALNQGSLMGSDIVAYDTPSAWNGMAGDGGSMVEYGAFDNMDDLYAENDNFGTERNAEYGKVNFTDNTYLSKQKLSKDRMEQLLKDRTNYGSYYDNHNVKGDNYYSDLKSRLAERERDTEIYNNMSINEYQKQQFSNYGIFDQLGISFDSLSIADTESVEEKYQRLLQDRNKNI